ncbi:CatB-related O-acetyltransferase [Desulfohalovibrio reitneri]|uniref:CatB-related O-acetyltransferase n=1 Tax=Desulfohalovibrio reitneri TaxID=1307759 RepID=UPI00110DAF02|nr:CatB-related O-acetyltransferase [Desulfohalovibrio reitneri]
MTPEFLQRLQANERRQILKGVLPAGLFRFRAWRRYRKHFPRAFVSSDSQVSLKADIGEQCIIQSATIGDNVAVGRYTGINTKTALNGLGRIVVGGFCGIGPDCYIWSENHNTRYLANFALETTLHGTQGEYEEFVGREIVIGNDVWIGRGVTILAGARIGDGSVVAAGSVVTAGEYPPYAVLGGVPAKVIKMRFSERTIERLLEMRWWDRPAEEIFGPLLTTLRQTDFLE